MNDTENSNNSIKDDNTVSADSVIHLPGTVAPNLTPRSFVRRVDSIIPASKKHILTTQVSSRADAVTADPSPVSPTLSKVDDVSSNNVTQIAKPNPLAKSDEHVETLKTSEPILASTLGSSAETSSEGSVVPDYETKIKINKKKTARTPLSRKKKTIIIALASALLVVLLAGLSFHFYNKSAPASVASVVQNADAQKQLEDTLALVSKIAVLPQNDSPTLAIVSDPSQLKSDAFFDNAIVGDRVLIYPRIGRAIMYRPLTNQIVNMISFQTNNPQSGIFSGSTTTAKATVVAPKSK